ncbi:MAG: hypothetical protein ACOYMA_04840 [Bacteroidia bacterium]
MMIKKLFIPFLFLPIFQSCCKNSSFLDSNEQLDIGIVVQKKDNNGLYVNSKISNIEWLGANYIQNINADTAKGLSLNVKASQTFFKINHANGIDTIEFNYSWDPVAYEECYGSDDRMTRKVRGVSAISNNVAIQRSDAKIYIIKLK